MADLQRARDNLKCALNMGGLRDAADFAVQELDKAIATKPKPMTTHPVPVWTLFSNARRDKGLRMKQVAHDTGLSVHTVLNAEAEMVSTRVLFKLAQYYGIDGRDLMASVLRAMAAE